MKTDTLWKKFLDKINSEVNAMIYKTYFQNTQLLKIEDKTLIILVPSKIHQQRLNDGFYGIINSIILDLTDTNYELKFVLEDEKSKYVTPKQESLFDETLNPNSEILEEKVPTYKFNSNLNKNYTFDNFIVGNSNRLAHGCAFAVAENPGTVYNPLVIYGNSGLGKTHLMHAIGNYIEQNTKKRVLYISCNEFFDDFTKMSRSEDINNRSDYFKEKYRSVDVLIVDDIQFIANKTKSQEEFFHTFNSLYNNNKQIIVSSDRPPNDIKDLADRLKTRFAWGMNVDIHPPEFELRKNIIYKKINGSNLQKDIPEDVVEYIASNIGSNIRALEGAVTRLAAYSIIMGGVDINLETAVDALKDTINRGTSEQANILKIQRVVADYFQISIDDLKSKKRSAVIAFPRQIAMYLSRTLLNESFEQIGLEFGGKDHTTVMHSCEKIKNEIRNNQEIYNSIEKIKENLS